MRPFLLTALVLGSSVFAEAPKSLAELDGGLGLQKGSQGHGIPALTIGPGGDLPIRPIRPSQRASVTETDVSGIGLTPAEAKRALAAMRPRMKACFEQALAAEPELSGSVTLTVEIDEKGAAIRVSPAPGSFKGNEVGRCFGQRMLAFQFPPGAAGRVLTATLNFRLGEPPAPAPLTNGIGDGMPVMVPRPPPSLPVKVSESEISTTGLDKEVAHRSIARSRAGNKACYLRGLVDDPKLAGNLTVALELDATGTVARAVATGGSLKGTEVGACVLRRLYATPFPDGTPERTITATLTFAPEVVDAALGSTDAGQLPR